jgi:uncharacterized protein
MLTGSFIVLLLMQIILSLSLASCSSTKNIDAAKKNYENTYNAINLKETLRLAQESTEPNQKTYFKILSTKQLLSQAHHKYAAELFDSLNFDEMSMYQANQTALINTELNIKKNNIELAQEALKNINQAELSSADLLQLHDKYAEIYKKKDNPLGYLSESLFIIDKQQDINFDLIWSDLLHFSRSSLSRSLVQTLDYEIKGWLQLALIAKKSHNKNSNDVLLWKESYPNHPAQKYTAIVPNKQIHNIALLLPLNGSFKEYSQSIIQGFLFKHFKSPKKLNKIRIFDSTQDTLEATYNKISKDGNFDFILGPLTKNEVKHFASHIHENKIPVPTLLLNTVQDSTIQKIANLYQLDLSQANEIDLMTQKARSFGYEHAIIISENREWSNQLSINLEKSWEKLDGKIVDHISMAYDESNLNSKIKNVLNLNESYRRFYNIKRTINLPLKFIPYRRHDVDIIFLIVNAKLFSQLAPMLRFYFAQDLPIYTTSSILPEHLKDQFNNLSNIYFPLFSWNDRTQSKTIIRNVWGKYFPQLQKAYALGIDLYDILDNMKALQSLSQSYLSGINGSFSFTNKNHKIVVNSYWHTILNGKIRKLEN